MNRFLINTAPLHESQDFRRFWCSSALTAVGAQITTFAVGLQVYLITNSSVAVGLVALVSAVPAIVVGVLGGAVIDAVDRRRLVLVTTSVLAAVSLVLAAQALLDVENVGLLYVLVLVQSAVASVDVPARRTYLARLLPTDLVPAGAALNLLVFHFSAIAGPAIGGAIAAAGGVDLCYLVDASTFVVALYAVSRLSAMPAAAERRAGGSQAVLGGIRYAARNPVLRGALLTDISSTGLGMPFALLPAIVFERFDGDPVVLGLLTAAPAVGGLLGSVLSGPVSRARRQGRAMLVASGVWGAGIALFGTAHSLPLALAALAVAGAADAAAVMVRIAVVQVCTPDELRGRVSAAEYVVGVGFSQLGNFRAGAVGSLTSSTVSAVTGGLSCSAAAALLAVALPTFYRYESPPAGDPLADDPSADRETR